jgi:hypothetical protein
MTNAAENWVPPRYQDATQDHRLSLSTSRTSTLYDPSQPSSTNFLQISSTSGKIKGSWTIDPTLPLSSVAALPSGLQTRPNVFLESTEGIKATLRLVEGYQWAKTSVAAIVVKSYNESTHLKLHRSTDNPKISLRVKTSGGNVALELPRNFRGSITYQTHRNKADFAPCLEARMTAPTLDNRGYMRTYVGNVSQQTNEDDEIIVESQQGKLKLRSVGVEEELSTMSAERSSEPCRGLLKRLFKPASDREDGDANTGASRYGCSCKYCTRVSPMQQQLIFS